MKRSSPSPGDLKNCLLLLYSELKSAHYQGQIEPQQLSAGIPSIFLHLIKFILLDAFPSFASHIVLNRGYDLRGKRDKPFMEQVYRLLRDEFSYKPVLTRDQFFHYGFGARKILLLIDIFHNIKLYVQDMERRHKLLVHHHHHISSLQPVPVAPEPTPPPLISTHQSQPVLPNNVIHVLHTVTQSITELNTTLLNMQARMDRLEQAQSHVLHQLQCAETDSVQLKEQNTILRTDNSRLAKSLEALRIEKEHTVQEQAVRIPSSNHEPQHSRPPTHHSVHTPLSPPPIPAQQSFIRNSPPSPTTPARSHSPIQSIRKRRIQYSTTSQAIASSNHHQVQSTPISQPLTQPSPLMNQPAQNNTTTSPPSLLPSTKLVPARDLVSNMSSIDPKLKSQLEEAERLRVAISQQLSATHALLAQQRGNRVH